MLTTDQISDDLWILCGLGDDDFFACAAFPVTGGRCQLVIGKFLGHETRIIHGRAYVMFQEETYRTEVWCEDHAGLLTEVVKLYKNAALPTFPIELVYNYGGTINSEYVQTIQPEEVH